MRLPVTIAFTAALAWAQPWAVQQVRVTGGDPDSGKCSIEVEVDGAAEIEIEGIQGRMRSLGGEQPVWQRLDCRGALPPSARDFRFRAVEGRGSQYLVREPRQNRGITTIRIEDPRNGKAKYAFELEWSGSGGLIAAAPRGGFGDGGFQGGGIINPTQISPPDGWNQQIRFEGAGDGFHRKFTGGDSLLEHCTVNIEQSGRVRIEFKTNRRDSIVLNGRLVHTARNRLVASVSGGGMDGTMELSIDRRNRIEAITMSGEGRNRFELRWKTK